MELAPETETLTLAISEQIRVDGTLTEASLSTDGKIRWKTESGERRLAIESEVLGFSAEGPRIRVRALVQREGWCCGDGGGGNRERRDLVLEPMTEESKIAWCGKLREFIDSLGEFLREISKKCDLGGGFCHWVLMVLLIYVDGVYSFSRFLEKVGVF